MIKNCPITKLPVGLCSMFTSLGSFEKVSVNTKRAKTNMQNASFLTLFQNQRIKLHMWNTLKIMQWRIQENASPKAHIYQHLTSGINIQTLHVSQFIFHK